MTPEIILAGAYAIFSVPIAAAGYWAIRRRSAKKRNAEELCARCAGPLYAPGAGEGPSLVEGTLHCSPCAARLRVRTRAGLVAFAAWTGTTLLAAGALAFTEGFGVSLALGAAAIVQTTVYAGGAVALMRRRNRAALQALAARGEIAG